LLGFDARHFGGHEGREIAFWEGGEERVRGCGGGRVEFGGDEKFGGGALGGRGVRVDVFEEC
jgi:hypothetical protein